MLIGEYKHTLDSKGRVIIPAKFRQELGEDFIITRGLDGCLFGYSVNNWHLLEDKLARLPLNKRDTRSFVRFFYSAATESRCDKQGRVNIPLTLRQHAALNKKCVIVGISDRIEIWAEERWQRFTTETEAHFDEIAENMLDF